MMASRMMLALTVALLIVLAGCLDVAGGEIESNAQDAPADETGPEGVEGAPTVVDMSGEILEPSVGVFGIGTAFEVGIVPYGEDEDAAILIEFQPDLGPAALSITVCIAAEIIGFLDCDVWEYSTGNPVQLNATGLSGKTIFLRTDYGAGTGTAYALCASVFDFHPAADDYTALSGDDCHDPAGEAAFTCQVSADVFDGVGYYSDPGIGGCGFGTLDAPHVFLAYEGTGGCEPHQGTDTHSVVWDGTLREGARYEAGTWLWALCEVGVVTETVSITFVLVDAEA